MKLIQVGRILLSLCSAQLISIELSPYNTDFKGNMSDRRYEIFILPVTNALDLVLAGYYVAYKHKLSPLLSIMRVVLRS